MESDPFLFIATGLTPFCWALGFVSPSYQFVASTERSSVIIGTGRSVFSKPMFEQDQTKSDSPAKKPLLVVVGFLNQTDLDVLNRAFPGEVKHVEETGFPGTPEDHLYNETLWDADLIFCDDSEFTAILDFGKRIVTRELTSSMFVWTRKPELVTLAGFPPKEKHLRRFFEQMLKEHGSHEGSCGEAEFWHE